MTRVDHSHMANAIRALAMDAVEKAKSGHPGLPMGAADIATVLFTQFLKFDAADPRWPDRDRFILSAGHGSTLLYALLYLTGNAEMTLDQIKNFRQLGSKTPGHPENFLTSGVETTSGPLGQGVAFSVGSALAERLLAAEFGEDIVDHYTYVLCSDGDLMEGVSHEAISLAGHLKLSKLIFLYDDNGITIDGPLTLTDSVDQVARFKAHGWNAVAIDGHDQKAIAAAITQAQVIRPAFADRLQDHHRFRRTEQGGHLQGPWRAARRRRTGGRQEGAGMELRTVRNSRRRAAGLAQCRQAGRQRKCRLAQPLRRQARGATRRIYPARGRSGAAARPWRSHPQAQGQARCRSADSRHPQGERDGARGAGPRNAGTCCSGRPTSPLPTTPAPRG